MDIQSLIQPHVRDLQPYSPPDWEALAARAGTRPDRLVRLDANENPYGPSPRVAEALAQFDAYGAYPDYRALTEAVARYARVAPDNIVLGNGGDEIIDLLVRLFVAPGEGVIICPPAFSMYAVCTQAHRGQVLAVPRRDDFGLDVEGIEALAAKPGADPRAKLLFIASPGNPDGQVIPLETIRRLLQLPLAIVVDEAYIEFGGESAVGLIDAHPNVIVLRTLSKWAGMAGLRLGYAVATPEIAGALARLRSPYNVNAAVVVAALATFNDMGHVRATAARIVTERERLEAALADLPDVHPLPSQANFVFFRLERSSGQEVADALASRGILVRSFSDPGLADAVRVTVGRPNQNEAFLAALYSALYGSPYPQAAIPKPSSGTARAERQPALSKVEGPTRSGKIHRHTRETVVAITLDLDGRGEYEIDTGVGFLDHMLAQIAAHGLFDLAVRARGDLHVDEHHTVEDVAIGLGQALDEALADRRGIVRMGHAYAPLDEALARVAVDLSGRPYAVVEVEFIQPHLGTMGTDLVIHFLETVAIHARASLHARVLCGRNDHHKAEALFKALGRALDAATRLDPRRQDVPSTKGVL
jgi:histidinol-phosphate aminotransferase